MPRHCLRSAAGALVLLVAGCAPSLAQYAGDQPLRGSIAPDEQLDTTPPDAGAAAAATPPSANNRARQQAVQPQATDSAIPPAVPPLGGMGDEPEGTRTGQPLGGIGDEPNTDPREAPQRNVEPGAGLEQELEELNVSEPDRALSEPIQLHSALLPEPHDIDPYIPIGIRIGTFLLFPEAAFGTILTNNVLDTRFDTHSDIAGEQASKLRVESDWSRHFFSAEVNSQDSWYKDYPIEDERNYQVVLRGRIDVTTRTHLQGEAETSQIQEGPSSISLTDISHAQTLLHEEHVTVSADHTFNRLTLKLTGTIADYNYNDASDPTLVGPVPLVDIRDYSEMVGTLRSTYEFQPSWAGFIQTSVNERDYKEPISTGGIMRGSSGASVAGGVNLRLAGTLFGEISLGWGQQQPIDDTLEPISGPLLNGDLIWLPTPATKVEFLARSEIDETTLVDSAGAIDRFYELSLQHAFWRYLVLGVYGSYEVADFVGDPEIDQRIKGGLTAEYYFNPVLSLYGRYEHTAFISTDAASDFVEDEVRLGMKLRR